MRTVAHRMFLAPGMALLMFFATGSEAMADCKETIDSVSLIKAVKLATAIKFGVSKLVTGDSGDHPGYLMQLGLNKFGTALDAFVSDYQSDVPNSSFRPEDYCQTNNKGQTADSCFYCPKSTSDQACQQDYHTDLYDDVLELTFGIVDRKHRKFGTILNQTPIDPSESVACIAKSFDKTFSHDKDGSATQLALSLYTILGSLLGDPSNLYSTTFRLGML